MEENKSTSETTVAESETQTSWPWKPFVAGIITSLVIFQFYNVISSQDQPADGEYPEVVATVNGEDVSREDFEEAISQSETFAQLQGIDVNDPTVRGELEQQALDIIINTRVLIAAAADADIEVSEEEIAEQYAAIEAQLGGAEALAAQMESLGLSEEELHEDIVEQIMVDTYIRNNTDTSVSDEEIQTLYDSLVAQGQELPPLDTVRTQIQAQLEGQKQQEAITELVEKLKSEADIDVKL